MAAIEDVSAKPIAELISLAGRSAVVTGAAQGLGKAIARRLHEAGANVMLGDCNEAGAKSVAEEINSAGHAARATSERVDVASEASVVTLAKRTADTFGGIDIWVNNAGIYPRGMLLDMTSEAWDQVLGVNLRGVLMGTREAARHMIAAGKSGVVVNIASTAGLRGTGAGLASYVGSKHGVVGLTRQLALELAPHRIRVLAVAPGLTMTEGVAASTERNRAEGGEQFVFPSPLGRIGVPDDIARVVLFCASDLSMLMTGAILPVDAGQTV